MRPKAEQPGFAPPPQGCHKSVSPSGCQTLLPSPAALLWSRQDLDHPRLAGQKCRQQRQFLTHLNARTRRLHYAVPALRLELWQWSGYRVWYNANIHHGVPASPVIGAAPTPQRGLRLSIHPEGGWWCPDGFVPTQPSAVYPPSGHLGQNIRVAVLFDLKRQFRSAGFDDTALGHNVYHIRLYVIQ